MADQPKGCPRTTGAVMGEKPPAQPSAESTELKKEIIMTARVGQKATDFEAPAYYQGALKTVKLSDSLGRRVLVCFYPGDFTFV